MAAMILGFYVLIYFWHTRTILLLDQVSIYAGGFRTFWLLTAISYRSLGSTLICRCITFWNFIATLLIDMFLFQIRIFIVITVFSKQEWYVYIFLFFLLSNLCVYSSSYLCFYITTIYALLCNLAISFLFLTISRGPSGMSIHLLILPYTEDRSTFFQLC